MPVTPSLSPVVRTTPTPSPSSSAPALFLPFPLSLEAPSSCSPNQPTHSCDPWCRSNPTWCGPYHGPPQDVPQRAHSPAPALQPPAIAPPTSPILEEEPQKWPDPKLATLPLHQSPPQ